MLYFAYGSNTFQKQMETRCEDSVLFETGYIENAILMFCGQEHGVMTIDKTNSKNDIVHGVLYKISKSDEASLDRYEGFPSVYKKVKVQVIVGNDKFNAMTYVKVDKTPCMPTSKYYRRCENGYIENNLPTHMLYDCLIETVEKTYSR